MKYDLLIIDADGTIAPHLTVGLANNITQHQMYEVINEKIPTSTDTIQLILRNVLRGRFPRINRLLLQLIMNGIIMYMLRFFNHTLYRCDVKTVSNKLLIEIFINAIKPFNIISFSKKVIEDSMYPGVKRFIDSFKCKKVIISQSFLLHHYKEILKLDEVVSNKFVLDKNNNIKQSTIMIKNAADKKRYAQQLIRKYKAKNVLLLCNDYEDIGMASLPEIKCIIANNPPKRLRKIANVVVDNDYRSLLA